MSEKQLIRRMDNKSLIYAVNKIRKEKENPDVYGKHGTSRWVTASEFWGGHHQDLRNELQRRKEQGVIKKTAGRSVKQRNSFGLRISRLGF